MLNLSKVIKPWKEADALSAHINLYGFWSEHAFFTKSGDLGMVLSVAGVDYESLDNDEQQYAVKRLNLRSKPSVRASMSTNIYSKPIGRSFHLRAMTMNLLTRRLTNGGSSSSLSATGSTRSKSSM